MDRQIDFYTFIGAHMNSAQSSTLLLQSNYLVLGSFASKIFREIVVSDFNGSSKVPSFFLLVVFRTD